MRNYLRSRVISDLTHFAALADKTTMTKNLLKLRQKVNSKIIMSM